MADVFDIERFYKPHELDYSKALAEVRACAKRSHWMWFIFPQHKDLGESHYSKQFGLSGIDEAKAFLADPIVGPHLLEITRALLALETTDPDDVFGGIDTIKLKSSMTLFLAAAPNEPVFQRVLDKFFNDQTDERTLSLIN